MKLLFKIIKRIVFGAFILYLYNYFAISFNMVVPINCFTLLVVTCFDVFGLLGLIIFKFFIM